MAPRPTKNRVVVPSLLLALVIGGLLAGLPPLTETPRCMAIDWNLDADGGWHTATNWSPATIPSGNEVVATFGDMTTAARTVTVNSEINQLGTINFDGDQSYLITGALIRMDTGSDDALINAAGTAAHEIASNLDMRWVDLYVTNDSTGDLTLSGALVQTTGTRASEFHKYGTGTVVLSNTGNSYSGSTVVDNGTLIVSGEINSNAVLNLNGGDLVVTGSVDIGAGRLKLSNGNSSITLRGGDLTVKDMDNNAVGAQWIIEGGGGSFTSGGGWIDNGAVINPLIGSSGLTPINSTGNLRLVGTVDVDVLGAAAYSDTDSYTVLTRADANGNLGLADDEGLWTTNDATVGNTLTATLAPAAELDQITLKAIVDPLEFTAPEESGWVDLVNPNLMQSPFGLVLWMNDSTGLDDLATWMSQTSGDAWTSGPNGTLSLADLMSPATGGSAFFAWDFSDYNAANATNFQVAGMAAVVPEPSTFALLGLGMLGLGWVVRRRRR